MHTHQVQPRNNKFTFQISYSCSEMDIPDLHTVDSQFPKHPKPVPLPTPISSSTRSFWLHSSPTCNPLADQGATDSLPSNSGNGGDGGNGIVDIVIIGSGITGISTLYHLVQELRRSSRSVKRVVVLEARTFCSGATGRNGGECGEVSSKYSQRHEKGAEYVWTTGKKVTVQRTIHVTLNRFLNSSEYKIRSSTSNSKKEQSISSST